MPSVEDKLFWCYACTIQTNYFSAPHVSLACVFNYSTGAWVRWQVLLLWLLGDWYQAPVHSPLRDLHADPSVRDWHVVPGLPLQCPCVWRQMRNSWPRLFSSVPVSALGFDVALPSAALPHVDELNTIGRTITSALENCTKYFWHLLQQGLFVSMNSNECGWFSCQFLCRYVYVGAVLCLFTHFFIDQYLGKPKSSAKSKKAPSKNA